MLADPNQLKLAGLILNFTMQSCTRMGGSSGARLIHEHLHTKTPAHFFGDGVVVLVLGERHDLLGHIPNSRPQQRKKIIIGAAIFSIVNSQHIPLRQANPRRRCRSLVFTCSNMSSTLLTAGHHLIEGLSSNTSKGASTIDNTKQVNKNIWKLLKNKAFSYLF